MLKCLGLATATGAYLVAAAVPASVAGGLMLTAASSSAEAKVYCYTRPGRRICRGTPDPLPPKPDPKGIKMK